MPKKTSENLFEKTTTVYKYRDEVVDAILKIKNEATNMKKIKQKAVSFSLFKMMKEIFHSKESEYRIIKAAFCFPIGCGFGFSLYYGVIQFMDLDEFVLKSLSLILGLMVGIGYSLSVQIRCMCWLVIPALFGKSGRAYLGTLALTHVINGPYEDIVYNTNESIRVIGCASTLSFNHSLERLQLMFQPVREVAAEFLSGSQTAQKESRKMMETFEPLEEEVRDESDMGNMYDASESLDETLKGTSRMKRIDAKYNKMDKKGTGKKTEVNYRKKLEYRCETVFTEATVSCRNKFASMYDSCMSKLWIVGYIVCWPMLIDSICDIVAIKGGEDACVSRKNVNDGFGESVDTMSMVDEQMTENFQVNVQYKLNIEPQKLDQITPQDITKSLLNQFDGRRRLANLILTIFKRILAFMFIYVLLTAKSYNSSYLSDIKHDNIYITNYFRRIDERRKEQGKMHLLPLKKAEKKLFVNLKSLKLAQCEKKSFITGTVILLVQVLTVLIIVALGYLFYQLLIILQHSSEVEFRQRGIHHIELNVFGNGFLAKIIRAIVKSFKVSRTVDKITNTVGCLPHPRILDKSKITHIFVVYGIMWFFIITQAYGLRLRNIICGFFYTKRQKKRVLYLYNQQLKKRKSYLKRMRHEIRKKVRDEGFTVYRPLLQILCVDYPKIFGWLKTLKLGLRTCIMCDEKETPDYYICPNKCGSCYCQDCWKDMKRECYICRYLQQDAESETSSDEI